MSLLGSIPIIGEVIEMGQTWLQGRNERQRIKQQAKAEALQSQLAHKGSWEMAALQGAGWKDEYLTVLISIPLIACFIPGGDEWVDKGFDSLSGTPDWYPTLIMVVFSAVFGRKELPKVMKSFKEVFRS